MKCNQTEPDMSSPTTTMLSENDHPSTTTKRFTRNTSRSRSKSKEEHRQIHAPHFYVKNVCNKMVEKQSEMGSKGNRSQKGYLNQSQKVKREDTPVKNRK